MLDTDVKEADRLRAASMLQDRAWGKSPEVIAITDDSQNFGKLLDTVAGAQPDEEAYDPDISRINNSLTFGELGDEDIVDASWEEVGE